MLRFPWGLLSGARTYVSNSALRQLPARRRWRLAQGGRESHLAGWLNPVERHLSDFPTHRSETDRELLIIVGQHEKSGAQVAVARLCLSQLTEFVGLFLIVCGARMGLSIP